MLGGVTRVRKPEEYRLQALQKALHLLHPKQVKALDLAYLILKEDSGEGSIMVKQKYPGIMTKLAIGEEAQVRESALWGVLEQVCLKKNEIIKGYGHVNFVPRHLTAEVETLLATLIYEYADSFIQHLGTFEKLNLAHSSHDLNRLKLEPLALIL
ncbi:hsp70 nucleotide exchange factor fes1 [Senna tora]|uniref:Hsp70 nucleotide exchange factor fes1 n=1 Tax=Senna tora TaxID=362788 RepID=A0A834WRF1_9FABA|nr:hsp70 nucleotide exchange factor fes1 [Senna tora]